MAKFTVTLKETVFYTVEVEAEGEETARVDAVEIWNQSEDPSNDFCGSGQGVEVGDVEVIDASPKVHEYLFDVKLFAAIRVRATSEVEAREMMIDKIGFADANLGAWPSGDPIICEVSLDEPENDALVEFDGVDMDEIPFHPESPEGRAWMADRLNEDGSLKSEA